jgi:hypothetical protein
MKPMARAQKELHCRVRQRTDCEPCLGDHMDAVYFLVSGDNKECFHG